MFVVTEAEAAATRAVFALGGEVSAAVGLRRLFSLITDITEARECARTIAVWRSMPAKPRLVRRLRLPVGGSGYRRSASCSTCRRDGDAR
jgi:hypothetical protein